jgi:type II secretory pathway pseudopilin PulG
MHIVEKHPKRSSRKTDNCRRGFSMVELLVSMGIFMIVAGAAFTLFDKHAKLVTRQQNLSGVNIGMRNAMSQIQMDLAGAGTNLLAGASTSTTFGLGVIIQNNVPGVAPACAANPGTWAYPVPSSCFDSFTVISPKPCNAAGGLTAPVLVVNENANGNNQASVAISNSSILWADDPNNPGNGAALQNDANCYKTGDEVLVVSVPNNGQPQCTPGNPASAFSYCMSFVVLTKDAAANGNGIQLQHNPTGAGVDPLGLFAVTNGGNNFNKANGLNYAFPNGSYIIDLGNGGNAITYAVQTNANNAADPQLLRCLGTTCTAANSTVLTDQVIGFKIGAALWDNAALGATEIANFFYNSANYCSEAIGNADCTQVPPPANDPNDFTLVRAVRISMIGRTTPSSDLSVSRFQNGFDNGPYWVQQASVVVDLRNMSKNDMD